MRPDSVKKTCITSAILIKFLQGEEGVTEVLEILQEEFKTVMILSGILVHCTCHEVIFLSFVFNFLLFQTIVLFSNDYRHYSG